MNLRGLCSLMPCISRPYCNYFCTCSSSFDAPYVSILMCGSFYFDRSLNVEIGVEFYIFVYFLLFCHVKKKIRNHCACFVMNACFISSFVFHQFWRQSYQNQLSFSGKDSTAENRKMGWKAHKSCKDSYRNGRNTASLQFWKSETSSDIKKLF